MQRFRAEQLDLYVAELNEVLIIQTDEPPLRALRVLATLARFERHKDAAEALGVTTSAISQQIRALEQWLGAEVVDRGARRPVLTDIGRRLVDGVAEPLTRIEGACRALRRAGDDRRIVVSAPGAYLSYVLIPTLHEFWRDHADIEVDIRMASSFDAPAESHGVDIAIRFLHAHETARPLGRRGWRAVCRRSYFEAQGRPKSLGDVREATLLHESVYNFWPTAFAAEGLEAPASMSYRPVGDATHVMASVLAGEAFALLPGALVQRAIRDGALVSPFNVRIEREAAYFAEVARTGRTTVVDDLIELLSK